jgi:GDP-L-fucose synthase
LDLRRSKIYVAGHGGMVGSSVIRRLDVLGCRQVLVRNRAELDLCDQAAVQRFFEIERPEVVVFAAAKVGGIQANNAYPAEFIYQNLAMATHVVHAAYRSRTERLLFLGSTCIYPRMAEQPIKESSLLTSVLEPTNEAYAIAKIAGLKLCQYYRGQYGVMFHSAMPTNLYGPGDNYHPEHSHVVPALIRRFHEAKVACQPSVTIWGTGSPRREFLHVDDLAEAIIHLLQLADPPDWVNVGTGTDVTIRCLAETIAEVVGYHGEICYDTSKPDGTPVKRTDIRLIRSTGWSPRISLREGLEKTYDSFVHESELQLVREV